MDIIEAIERSPITLPISRVMDSAGNFTIVPDVQRKGYFDIDYRHNELVLVAGKFIGQIPLTNDLAIHVRPKVPLTNLARLIGIANAPIHCLEFFRRRYAVVEDGAESIQEGMAKAFVACLKTLDSEGVYREYKLHHESSASPKGRIDFKGYITTSVSKGKPLIAPCQYYLLDADTLFNRVIKLALFKLGKTLSQAKKVNIPLIRQIEYFYDLFPAVELDDSDTLIYQLRSELEQKRIPDLRHYYADLVDIALIIVQQGSVDISSRIDGVSMSSFILNLEDTFEKYIRELMFRSVILNQEKIIVSDGNTDARGKLFFDNLLYDAKPDFVIADASGRPIVGDAKYKLKVSEADRYQVITHSLAFDSHVAFIVIPSSDGCSSGAHLVGTVNRQRPISFYEYRFNLASPELSDEESKFCTWVAQRFNN